MSSSPLPAECQHCEHQSIGQCNEASADNMMAYSECLDMMRHQIIMLQERKTPVNVVSADNPWQEWWRTHPWKHMTKPHRRHDHRQSPRWIETANENPSSTSCSVSFGQGKRLLVSTVTERWPTPIHKAEQANHAVCEKTHGTSIVNRMDYTDGHDVT